MLLVQCGLMYLAALECLYHSTLREQRHRPPASTFIFQKMLCCEVVKPRHQTASIAGATIYSITLFNLYTGTLALFGFACTRRSFHYG